MTDLHDAPAPAGAAVDTVDAVIVGAGFAGMYMLHKLRGLGFSAVVYEAGRRRRRHVVLEPLPGRPLRRREHQLLVLVRRRARAGVGVDRALRHPARDPALRQPRRRPLRPAPGHPVPTTGVGGRASTRRAQRWTITHRPGRRRLGAAPRHGRRLPVDVEDAGDPGHRDASRATGTTPATGRTRASTSPASASASSAPARRRSSRSRSSPSRPPQLTVFQRTPNFSLPAKNAPARPARRWPSSRRATREHRAGGPRESGFGVPNAGAREVGARGHRGGARGDVPGAASSRATSSGCCSRYNDLHHEQGGQRHRRRVRPRADPRDRRRPRGRRDAVPDGPPARHQAAVPRHRLLRDVQPAATCELVDLRKTPLIEITRAGIRTTRAGVRVRRIVFATGFDAMTGSLIGVRHQGPRRRRCSRRSGRPARGRTSAWRRPGSRTCG